MQYILRSIDRHLNKVAKKITIKRLRYDFLWKWLAVEAYEHFTTVYRTKTSEKSIKIILC